MYVNYSKPSPTPFKIDRLRYLTERNKNKIIEINLAWGPFNRGLILGLVFGEFRWGGERFSTKKSFVPLFISVKMIIRPGRFSHEIDFPLCARPRAFHPILAPPPFDFLLLSPPFRARSVRSVGSGSRGSMAI